MRWLEPQRFFVLAALVFGTLIALISPPYQAPDEQHHFFRAYQISEGHLAAQWHHNLAQSKLPLSLDKTWEPFSELRKNRTITSFDTISNALKIPLDSSTLANFKMATAHYSPIAYIPQALVILPGRLLNFRPLILMYLARMANLGAWTALGYWALRIAPSFGRPLLLLMLMPMSIYIASSVSADAITNAMAFVLVALTYSAATQQDDMQPSFVGWSWIAKFIICSSILALSKAAYLPLAGLIFIVPIRRFGGLKKFALILVVLAIFTAFPVIIWSHQTPGLDMIIPYSEAGVAPRQQAQYLYSHPSLFFTLPYHSIRRDYVRAILSFVGTLGWLDIQLAPLFVFTYLIAMILACRPSVSSAAEIQHPWRAAVISALTAAASAEALLLFLYLIWTAVGSPIPEGIQGRYFIPTAAALLLFTVAIWKTLPHNLRPPHPEHRRNAFTAAMVLVGCGYVLILLYYHYYVSVDVGSLP